MSKIVKHIGQIDSKISKSDLVELAKQHSSEILENDKYDLLKVYIEFKRYEIYLKTLISEVKNETIQRAKEDGTRDFEYGSTRITVSKQRKFDYSVDEHWQELDDKLEELKALKKEREKMLQNIKGEYKEVVDEETGEVQRIAAPPTEYSEVLRIKL
jgi:hypothetical protein